ncbi:MAG: recombinase family protein [Lachnospiraceae bacterium]|nr:recombinase family protein [Lachnospiraceae bacterium]
MARKSRKPEKQPSSGVGYQPLTLCRTGIYVRLSVEDNGGEERDSIQNQREYLEEYVNRKHDDLQLVRVYADNGTSGTNFDREGWQKMMEDIKAGEIQCIVVKDFSRMGRNYIEVGNYLEKVFPFLGVRVISVNDSFDSRKGQADGNMLMNSLLNIVNDYYAKDISRKVVQARRIMQENGEYTGGVCSYGYKKADTDKRKLAVDPEAADVVKKIFQWRVQGKSNAWIANSLNELAIPSPGLYRYRNGNQGYRNSGNAKWNISHISGILKNPVYLGHLVQGKSKRSYFKDNGKKRRLPKEEWIVTENAHEALVTQEQFDIAADMARESHARYQKQREANAEIPHMGNILCSKIYCGQCGRRMARRSRVKAGVRKYYFFCDSNRTKLDAECTRTMVWEIPLMEIIRNTADRQLQLIGAVLEQWEQIKDKGDADNGGRDRDTDTGISLAEREQELAREIFFIKKKKQELYEDMKDGMLAQADYERERGRIAGEQMRYEKELREISIRNEAGQETMGILGGYYKEAVESGSKEIPVTALDHLIEKIIVLSPDRIEAVFAYADLLEQWCEEIRPLSGQQREGGV